MMNNKTYGFFNRIAYVDLSTKEMDVRSIDESLYKKFVGGSGLATALFVQMTGHRLLEPLDTQSPLIFMTGPLTGTSVPSSSRFQVVARSPLTEIFGEADGGGSWGYYLKRAGLDGIIIQGRSESPVYLWVYNGVLEIRPADHLWGKDTFEIDPILKEETLPQAVVASIGQAGEQQVKVASVMSEGRHARPAARCGLGAVMGSKNLKAIVVYGNQEISIADLTRLRASIKAVVPGLTAATEGMKKFGTAGGYQNFEKVGDLPIKNWREGRWEAGAEKVNGILLTQNYTKSRYHCRGCVIGCGRTVENPSGPYAVGETAGPEYETLASFGSLCMVDNLELIVKANELCNRYGIDTISTGTVIAFAMEAFEKGVISYQDTGGLDLTWGNGDAVIELTHQIGKKQGLGVLLGRGVKEVADILGRGAEDFAIHAKGLEFACHDPRAFNSLAVGYATSNRGACHLQAMSHGFERVNKIPDLGFTEVQNRFSAEGKGHLTATMQNLMCLFDSLKLCKFLLFGSLNASTYVEWLNGVTGWELSLKEFLLIGERIFNLKRLYNARLGVDRSSDCLPKRILTEPRGAGGAADNLPPLEPMLADYYKVRNWSEDGIVSPDKIAELGLEAFDKVING